MGWHYDLKVRCTIREEFLDFYTKTYIKRFQKCDEPNEPWVLFLKRKYDNNSDSDSDSHSDKEDACTCEETLETVGCPCMHVKEYATLTKLYKDLVDCWIRLDLDPMFYKYELKGSEFMLHISKKVTRHKGDLLHDLTMFVKDVIVPTSTLIHFCEIESDDFGDTKWVYTDLELRGGSMRLQDIVRSVEHVWVEGTIAETRIVYKRGIPKQQQLDLDRLFQR